MKSSFCCCRLLLQHSVVTFGALCCFSLLFMLRSNSESEGGTACSTKASRTCSKDRQIHSSSNITALKPTPAAAADTPVLLLLLLQVLVVLLLLRGLRLTRSSCCCSSWFCCCTKAIPERLEGRHRNATQHRCSVQTPHTAPASTAAARLHNIHGSSSSNHTEA